MYLNHSFILNLLLILVLLTSSCSKPKEEDWNANSEFSIMSFNLRFDNEEDGENKWSNRKAACLIMLNEYEPSIFGIQEGLYNQVSFLDENLPKYSYIGVGRDDGYSGGEYSAIFYSKEQFDLIKSQNFWLSETPEYSSLGWDANNIRCVTWAHLKDKLHNDKSVFIFNTHFDHKGQVSRVESAKLLVNKIQEITDDNDVVFITGDLNVLIRNKALTPIIKQFYSARRFAKYTDNIKSFNFFGRWYLSRNIDFIFYKNAQALSFRTVSEDYGVPYISDHYPIITHFNY